ncbi:MAG: 4-hydroxythreonine-4-phosphate dehydrogenase 2 [Pseudomonadota bacterium]|jgi:4-hydroxythreonine-4-phosphate dehydrogenase
MKRPTIALFTGDPAGIGPELVGQLLADGAWREQAEPILIAQHGALNVPDDVRWHDWPGRQAAPFSPGQAQAANGAFMLAGLQAGLDLVQSGQAQAFCFAPLNKSALRQAGMHQEDELRWFAERLGHEGPCGELNVLAGLWTSRVTSHVALREVADLLRPDNIVQAIVMISQALRASGVAAPRVAVCGLNPHNGDHGNYGDEEGRLIEPAVEAARALGYPADGPFPADTAFVRARRQPGYDGVVTMYHDQGQIAMKLLGFEQGVTVHGGLPFPITTPAHGTAYDIVGQGVANPQAMRNAFALAARMGAAQA